MEIRGVLPTKQADEEISRRAAYDRRQDSPTRISTSLRTLRFEISLSRKSPLLFRHDHLSRKASAADP